MATIVTRAGKGSPLTHNEVDANFTNLNTGKAELASPAFTGQASFADGTAAAPSIAHTGDLNAGLFFPAADTVAVTTGGTERMRIDASGNVGIGTSSPGYRVDVASADTAAGFGYAVRIRANATAAAGALQFTDPTAVTQNGVIAVDTSSNMKFTTSSTERLRIASAGQLGIGGANYGTSGQVLTSGGASAAPSWTTAGPGFAGSVWTSKAGSRANNTTYQNTTTGWLMVSVRDSNNGQTFSTGPASASLAIFNTNIAPGTALGLVPPSYYYSCSGSVLQSWYEGQV